MAGLADGRYSAGFRPNHVEIMEQSAEALAFDTRLVVTELTGSETFVHLDHHAERLVGVIHGVHELEIGAALRGYLDPTHGYMFAEDGALIAPASYALAA